MLELRRDRCGMEQGADTRAAKSLRPKFGQMIEWQLDATSVLYHNAEILAMQ